MKFIGTTVFMFTCRSDTSSRERWTKKYFLVIKTIYMAAEIICSDWI